MFDNSSVPTHTETEKEMQNGFVSMLGNVKLMVTGISTGHRLRHSPHRREHDGDGGARARHGGRRPPDARVPEGHDPRRSCSARASSSRSSAGRSAPLLFVGPLPRLPPGPPVLAHGRLRRRDAALPRDRRARLRHLRPRRRLRGPRPGDPLLAALDHGRPEAGGLMRFLPLVLKNLLRKKTRSGLTIGSILLPFFVICLLGTFVAMLDADPSQGRGMFRIAVRHKVSFTNFLPASHLEKIRQLPGVKAAMPFNWFGGRYVDFSAFNVFQRFARRSGGLLRRLRRVRHRRRLGGGLAKRPERTPRRRAPHARSTAGSSGRRSRSSATSGPASTRSRSGRCTAATTRRPSSSTRRSSTRPSRTARASTR